MLWSKHPQEGTKGLEESLSLVYKTEATEAVLFHCSSQTLRMFVSFLRHREDVERRFEGKLSKNMSGSLYEMVSRVMKALVNRKITVPGNFQG